MPFELHSDRHMRGLSAEESFADMMMDQGYAVRKSSSHEDRRHHIDYHMQKGFEQLRVDVKARKRVNGAFKDSLVWVEVENEFGNGWLYAPRVTHFAFGVSNGFLLISSRDLRDIVKEHYDEARIVTKSSIEVEKYPFTHCYRRPPRKYGNFKPLVRERTILVDVEFIKEKARLITRAS